MPPRARATEKAAKTLAVKLNYGITGFGPKDSIIEGDFPERDRFIELGHADVFDVDDADGSEELVEAADLKES